MLTYSRQHIDKNDLKAVKKALKSDFLTCGKKTDEFEKALCKYLGVKYVVVMNSATSALHIAYLCLGLQQNDEVITTPLTFVATSNAALMTGANVKFCDIKKDGNIDENQIEKLINKKTKVITSVDFGGNPVNVKKINEICKKHNLKFLSDSSHALGSEVNGKKVGTFADISIFSFHAIKPITTFEGGAIVTNDENIAKKARLYRSHGIYKKELWDSQIDFLGYNYRLSDVACSLGISQLKKLDKMIKKRKKIAKFYDKKFANNPYFNTIQIPKNTKTSYHLYPILFKNGINKKEIFVNLQKNGIGVQVHYKPTYQFNLYKEKYGEISLKNTENFYKSELSIPCHQSMSLKDAKFVANTLLKLLEN